ncbi:MULTISPECIES: signal peptidase I [Piscirickettsiaceae]|jgi:signal peptidase I|uniref:Signal peptidase I n=1 Tax=Hydrogenovibrio thermophilus TaxID=265883 RepID=A0A410H289_9GAMM|nr:MULTISPECIES: signal peptidase I [Piscirickettsiaceae]AZR82522.1 S26 family signal peptidase [Thiomicrospira sp. S5]QAB14920.1 signal peptidase I [Hydrogenovibrio thermophilus]
MSFELILVIITAITGVIVYVDRVVWKPKRDRSVTTEKEPVLVEYSRSLFPVFLIVLVLRSFVVEPFRIPSGSMYPTLEIGDFIVVNKFAYGVKLPVTQTKILPVGEPERGDVVVFKYPKDPDVDYIKRVIGLPGDEIAYYGKTLYINGNPVKQKLLGEYEGTASGKVMDGASLLEEFLEEHSHDILLDPEKSSQDMNTVVVPEGHYFMMGDNRDHSNDSRFWGFVPEKNLKGKAFAIWMNWDDGVHFDRIGKGIE